MYPHRPSGTVALGLIICLNFAAYAEMALSLGTLSFTARQAADWGATFGPWVLKGDWWRLWTANYVHFDALHLLLNMVALIAWGSLVSSRMGAVRFLVFYTLCGMLGSLTSVLMHPDTVSAGASGAISGVLGALVAFRVCGDRAIRGIELIYAVLFNVVFVSFMPAIDWQAHAGGFVAGFVLCFLVAVTLTREPLPSSDWA